MSPLSIGLCVSLALVAIVFTWHQVRIARAAAQPAVVAAASWWTTTITGMALSDGHQLAESTKRTFAGMMRKELARRFLKEGFYPMVSSQDGRLSREFHLAANVAGLSYNWIPPDVVMLVYPDCVTVKCGIDDEDQLQIVWSPA